MEFVALIAILIFSVVLHEVSHGVVANALGDPTAKNAGRLTINPIPHLDLIGSIILPGALILMSMVTGGGFIFGWAKPVPVNPANLRGRYDSAIVSLAGPGANLAIALTFGLALRLLPLADFNPEFYLVFGTIVHINILLAVFNLLPIPPLDGSHILFTFLPRSMDNIKFMLSKYGMFILLFIILFFYQIIWIPIVLLFFFITGDLLSVDNSLLF